LRVGWLRIAEAERVTVLKIRFDIPIEPYLICMTRFGINSSEYIRLKNGIVSRDADGHEIVQILCDHDHAKKILEMTAQLCPEAFPQIQHSLDLAGDL
jgi:hypothetical protein